MVEYTVEVKQTNVYHLPITASSEIEAIRMALAKMTPIKKAEYWVNKTTESEVL